MRADKFLWAVRLYKTRSLAAEAVKRGRVLLNGQPAKPSREIRPGDTIRVRSSVIYFEFRVEGCPPNRVPARRVCEFIVDITPREELDRLAIARLQRNPAREPGAGRPTKRERREMDAFRDGPGEGPLSATPDSTDDSVYLDDDLALYCLLHGLDPNEIDAV